MSDNILNQSGFWFLPDFLSDDILINTANTPFLNSVPATRIPFYYRSPDMVTKLNNDFLATSSSYFSDTHFSAAPASKKPPMMFVSPQAPPYPPSPPTSSLGENNNSCLNHSPAGFCSVYKGQVLKHPSSSPTWGIPITEVSQKKIMVHNREGEREMGFGGRCGWIPAWPQLLQQQRPNPLPRHGGSGMGGVLPGVSEMKRECAGTGVFLPRTARRYGTHLKDSSWKKPDGMGRKKVVQQQQKQLMHHHKKMQGEEDNDDGALTHESRLPHEWTY